MAKKHARQPGVHTSRGPTEIQLRFKSDLASGLLTELMADTERVFGEFYEELMEGIPGEKSLERASAIFQMNEAKLTARHRAFVSAVEIELEWTKIEMQRELDLMEMQGKAGVGPGIS